MAVSTIDPNGLNVGQLGGTRNVIINGNFAVWQRGTSFTPSSLIFGADRFAAYKAGASAGDYARSTDVPSGQGFTYSGYFNGADIRQSIELPAAGERGVFVDGSKWTLSFWVKAGASGTSTANLGWANGVTATSVTYWGSAQTYSYSTSWQKKTITFTVGGSITGSDAAVLVYISSVAGLYITGVQLEAGDVATPFEHRSIGEELSACSRYYQKIVAAPASPAQTYCDVCNANQRTTTASYGIFHHPVPMRQFPTLSYNTLSNLVLYMAATSNSVSALAYNGFSTTGSGSFLITTSAFGAAGNGGWLRIGSATDYIAFDAEL
jgi:hypothetical protein